MKMSMWREVYTMKQHIEWKEGHEVVSSIRGGARCRCPVDWMEVAESYLFRLVQQSSLRNGVCSPPTAIARGNSRGKCLINNIIQVPIHIYMQSIAAYAHLYTSPQERRSCIYIEFSKLCYIMKARSWTYMQMMGARNALRSSSYIVHMSNRL